MPQEPHGGIGLVGISKRFGSAGRGLYQLKK